MKQRLKSYDMAFIFEPWSCLLFWTVYIFLEQKKKMFSYFYSRWVEAEVWTLNRYTYTHTHTLMYSIYRCNTGRCFVVKLKHPGRWAALIMNRTAALFMEAHSAPCDRPLRAAPHVTCCSRLPHVSPSKRYLIWLHMFPSLSFCCIF